jgi:hypothetical protein
LHFFNNNTIILELKYDHLAVSPAGFILPYSHTTEGCLSIWEMLMKDTIWFDGHAGWVAS